ncbi:hypothetical protein IC582_008684 [Cucumis melo]|uniref:Protein GAST1-like n=1 Tax=Cucumis melo TaxID=3656 RepID=A0A1S3CMR4_CUCME|nr:protein GAST1 [Cucumis melo]
MGRKQIIEILLFVVMLLNCVLLAHNQAISEAPTPQPQTSANYSNPMHGVTEGSLQPQECGPRCTGRCSKTAFKKPCMFFCQKCCAKCLCVPYGTYGNKQTCPCYNQWKTKRGGPKCP